MSDGQQTLLTILIIQPYVIYIYKGRNNFRNHTVYFSKQNSRQENTLMAATGRMERLSINRRLCMSWINRMMKKQVQKQTADLPSQCLLMEDAAKEEMMTELRHSGESWCWHHAGKGNWRNTNRVRRRMQKRKQKSLDLVTLSTSEISSGPSSSYLMRKWNPLNHEKGEFIRCCQPIRGGGKLSRSLSSFMRRELQPVKPPARR